MKIVVRAKPRSHQTKVEKIDATHYTVSVTAAPVDGAANEAIEQALAEYFDVPPSYVQVAKGGSSKIKQVFIRDPQ